MQFYSVVILVAFLLAASGPITAAEVEPREIEFRDGAVLLKGTLFTPKEDAAESDDVPGIVLLGGAERGPRTPMKRRVAAHFASRGTASLIYDSPGTGASSGSALMQTKADRVREAIAAHRFLCGQAGVDRRHVGIWGISEGAGIAVLAASQASEIAFVIPVSGALGIPPRETARHRVEAMGTRQGLSAEEIRKAHVLEELLWELVSGADVVEWPFVHAKVRRWTGEPWEELIDLTRRARGVQSRDDRAKVQAALRRVLGTWESEPWFASVVVDPGRYERLLAMDSDRFFAFLERNPLAAGDWFHDHRELQAFPGVTCPVLALWGEDDLFVPAHHAAAIFRAAMTEVGNERVTIEILPGATHLLAVAEGSQEFAPDHLDRMAEWIAANARQ